MNDFSSQDVLYLHVRLSSNLIVNPTARKKRHNSPLWTVKLYAKRFLLGKSEKYKGTSVRLQLCSCVFSNTFWITFCRSNHFLIIYLLQDHCKMKNAPVKEINWATHKKDRTGDGYVSFICDIGIPKLTWIDFINILSFPLAFLIDVIVLVCS